MKTKQDRPRAFTLIEMLVVLVILGILGGITLGLATAMKDSGKAGATRTTIEVLDSIVRAYESEKGAKIPAFVRAKEVREDLCPPDIGEDDPVEDQWYVFPMMDGRPVDSTGTELEDCNLDGAMNERFDLVAHPSQPTGALFLIEAERTPGVSELVEGLSTKVLELRDVYAWGWELDNNGNPSGTLELVRLRVPVPIDAFGRPIRFVHPKFDGGSGQYWDPTSGTDGDLENRDVDAVDVDPDGSAGSVPSVEFRRSWRPFEPGDGTVSSNAVGDGDEGICPGNQSYFYSPGGDGDPGTKGDNVYAGTKPTYPTRTQDF